MKPVLLRLMTGLLCVVLGGCSSDGLEDLREFVKTAHADRKPRVEPLPEIKMQETFIYNSENLPDPFAAFNLKPQGQKSASGPRPDPNRRKEPLETFPLDSLDMVGTLGMGTQSIALVMAPDKVVHRVRPGNHMGQNEGRVSSVTDSRIDLVELVPDGAGGWLERSVSVALDNQ